MGVQAAAPRVRVSRGDKRTWGCRWAAGLCPPDRLGARPHGAVRGSPASPRLPAPSAGLPRQAEGRAGAGKPILGREGGKWRAAWQEEMVGVGAEARGPGLVCRAVGRGGEALRRQREAAGSQVPALSQPALLWLPGLRMSPGRVSRPSSGPLPVPLHTCADS